LLLFDISPKVLLITYKFNEDCGYIEEAFAKPAEKELRESCTPVKRVYIAGGKTTSKRGSGLQGRPEVIL
jgi:hypothetical protein